MGVRPAEAFHHQTEGHEESDIAQETRGWMGGTSAMRHLMDLRITRLRARMLHAETF